MDDQIDPGDNFFGINLSDCVTVAANSPSNAKAIHRAMAFVAEQASQSSGLQGIDQQAIAQGWNNALQAIPIMDSIVGLKAANAHLTRQLASQALAHAEQMEGMGGTRPFNETVAARMAVDPEFCAALEEDEPEAEAQTIVSFGRTILKQRDRIAQLEETEKALRKVIDMKESRIGGLKSQLAMRVTPATQPTDTQQTASDVKAAPERRPDGTLKPAAKAWEAPKQASDARRLGG